MRRDVFGARLVNLRCAPLADIPRSWINLGSLTELAHPVLLNGVVGHIVNSILEYMEVYLRTNYYLKIFKPDGLVQSLLGSREFRGLSKPRPMVSFLLVYRPPLPPRE